MGWLGWPPDQVMRTDVNWIILALAARTELLASIFGGKKQPQHVGRVAPSDWRTFRDRWNQGYKPKRRPRVARSAKGAANG